MTSRQELASEDANFWSAYRAGNAAAASPNDGVVVPPRLGVSVYRNDDHLVVRVESALPGEEPDDLVAIPLADAHKVIRAMRVALNNRGRTTP